MKKYYIYKGSGKGDISTFKIRSSEQAASPKSALKKAILGRGLNPGKYLVVAAGTKGGKIYPVSEAMIRQITEVRPSRSRYYD